VSLVAICVAAVAALAWLNRPRDEPTWATVDDAVRSFRAKNDGRTHILDMTHDYDGVSTIVLSKAASARWSVGRFFRAVGRRVKAALVGGAIVSPRHSSVVNASRVVGVETVTVAGELFEALHTESRSQLEGESTGVARREDWRRRSDGLLLRRTVSSTADTGLGGGTHYGEQCTIELLDPEPRR
jgi:hypothetical protein